MGRLRPHCTPPKESNTLQRKLTHRLDFHDILDLHEHPRANQDLPWLRFVAKPRGDIGYRPYRGIVEASLNPIVPSVAKPCAMPMPKPISCPSRRHFSVKAPTASRISSAMSTASVRGGQGNEIDQFLEVRSLLCPEADLEK